MKLLIELKRMLVLVALAGLAWGVSAAELATKVPARPRRVITAHAGAMGTEANTIASLKTLVKTKVDYVEVDVTFRPDGTPVIIHATKPTQTEGVLLADALAVLAPSGKMVQFDLKRHEPELLARMMKEIRAVGLEKRSVFGGVGFAQVETLQKVCPGIRYAINCGKALPKKRGPELDALIVRLKAAKAVGVNENYRGVTREVSDRLHAAGLLVSVWTANSPETFKRCEKLDPDNLTTRWIGDDLRQ